MLRKIAPLLLIALAGCTATEGDSGPELAADTPPEAARPAAPSPPPAAAATPVAVDDRDARLGAYHWRLQDARNAAGARIDALLVRPAQPVQFDFRDGHLRVSNACNGMSGAYRREGEFLRVDPVVATKMGCMDPAIAALDGEVMQRLQGDARVEVQVGATAQLFWRADNGDTLRFVGEKTPEGRFDGPAETIHLQVDAETMACPPSPQPCLRVREVRYDANGLLMGPPAAWVPFAGAIEGFEHEPGMRTVLRVKRYRVASTVAGTPQAAYVLDSMIESESVSP